MPAIPFFCPVAQRKGFAQLAAKGKWEAGGFGGSSAVGAEFNFISSSFILKNKHNYLQGKKGLARKLGVLVHVIMLFQGMELTWEETSLAKEKLVF